MLLNEGRESLVCVLRNFCILVWLQGGACVIYMVACFLLVPRTIKVWYMLINTKLSLWLHTPTLSVCVCIRHNTYPSPLRPQYVHTSHTCLVYRSCLTLNTQIQLLQLLKMHVPGLACRCTSVFRLIYRLQTADYSSSSASVFPIFTTFTPDLALRGRRGAGRERCNLETSY